MISKSAAPIAILLLASTSLSLVAQPNSTNQAAIRAASFKDRQEMMDLLHIPKPPPLPPADTDPKRSPNTHPIAGKSPNWTDDIRGHNIARSEWDSWSNYDPSKADVGPLPDPLLLKNGDRVTDADTWWRKRRPEILQMFQTEIYGKIPKNTPKVTWEIAEKDPRELNGKALRKHIIGHIDNSAYPEATPSINIMLYTPAGATKPVPTAVIDGGGFPLNSNVLNEILENGWGCATFNTSTVQADNGAGLRVGIIGLMNHGQQRKPDDWGVLAAWSWGLSRALDYFAIDTNVDAKHMAIEGHSRWGKEALLAAALDPRWGAVYCSCSGEGGAKLHRHDFGESVDNVCASGEYHWMAGNFLKYGGHWNDLPVDQHELIALVAPRPVFITGGTQDFWADPLGEFKACVAVGPVYRLLGKQDLGTTNMPEPDEALVDGDVAFREHKGGHTDVLDWPTFLRFADKYFKE